MDEVVLKQLQEVPFVFGYNSITQIQTVSLSEDYLASRRAEESRRGHGEVGKGKGEKRTLKKGDMQGKTISFQFNGD